MRKLKYIILILIIVLIAGSVSGYFIWGSLKLKKAENQQPMSVEELIKDPVYDQLVKIYGEVSYLGEKNQFRNVPDCPCFSLSSGGKTINIWYSSMKIIGPIEEPSVDVSEIKNGQMVIVIGELKSETKDREFKDFWAKKFETVK